MPESKTAQTVRVFNRGQGRFLHDTHVLEPGGFADVPPEVAKIWCEIKVMGSCPVVDGKNLPATTAPAPDKAVVEENAKLKAENDEMSVRLKNMEKLLAQAKGPRGSSGSDPLA